MKKSIAAAVMAITVLTLGSGCVQTMYTKSVSVTKDANGNIKEIVETESVTQPGSQSKYIQFENLKAKRGDTAPIEPK